MNKLEDMLKLTLENIKAMVDTETVIGKPIPSGDGSIVLPVSKVSFGFVVGGGEYGGTNTNREIKASEEDYPNAKISGGGVTVTPIGFFVCGKEKRFITTEKDAEGKWSDLLRATINTIKDND
jgi:sporulation protein YtfJ